MQIVEFFLIIWGKMVRAGAAQKLTGSATLIKIARQVQSSSLVPTTGAVIK
jgi:hypothetical protein